MSFIFVLFYIWEIEICINFSKLKIWEINNHSFKFDRWKFFFKWCLYNIKFFIILDYLLFSSIYIFYLFTYFIFKGQNEVKNNGTTYNIFFFSSFLLSHYAFIALGYRQEIITTILANSNQCKEQNQSVLSCLDFISMYKFTVLHASFNSSVFLVKCQNCA